MEKLPIVRLVTRRLSRFKKPGKSVKQIRKNYGQNMDARRKNRRTEKRDGACRAGGHGGLALRSRTRAAALLSLTMMFAAIAGCGGESDPSPDAVSESATSRVNTLILPRCGST